MSLCKSIMRIISSCETKPQLIYYLMFISGSNDLRHDGAVCLYFPVQQYEVGKDLKPPSSSNQTAGQWGYNDGSQVYWRALDIIIAFSVAYSYSGEPHHLSFVGTKKTSPGTDLFMTSPCAGKTIFFSKARSHFSHFRSLIYKFKNLV